MADQDNNDYYQKLTGQSAPSDQNAVAPITTNRAQGSTASAAVPAGDPVILTILGEAGTKLQGQQAVASVIANRARAHGGGTTAADIVTSPAEGFEAWNNAAARARTAKLYPPGSPAYQATQAAVGDIVSGKAPAPYPYTMFYGPKAQEQLGRKPPSFDDGTGADIGGNRFFVNGYNTPSSAGGVGGAEQDALYQKLTGGAPAAAPASAVGPLVPAVGAQSLARAPQEGQPPQAMVSQDDGDPRLATASPQVKGPGVQFSGPNAQGSLAMSPAQLAAWKVEVANGKHDPNATAGDISNPHVIPPNLPAPPVMRGGDYFIGPDGKKRQYVDPDPAINTAIRAVGAPLDSLTFGQTTGAINNLHNLGIGPGEDPRYGAALDAYQNNLMLGGKPTIQAGIQSLPNLLTGDFSQAYQHNLNNLTAEQDASRARFPIARDLGAVAGVGATLPATEVVTPFRGASLAARIANASAKTAAYGGAQGFLSTDRGDFQDRLNAGGENALVGAVAGPITEAAPGVAKNLIAPVGSARADLANKLINEYNIPLRAGQISENPGTRYMDSELVKSGPYAKSQNNQIVAFNRAVAKTIGEDANGLTPDVMNRARDRIGGMFDDVASRTSIPMDDNFISKLGDVYNDASKVLGDSELRPLANQIADIAGRADDNRVLSGDAYQALTRKGAPLDRAISSSDPNVGYYAGQLKDVLDDGLAANAAPEDLAQLANARRQWKNLRLVQPLAAKASTDGQISPALLLNRANSSYKDMAFTGAGDIGDLARGGQAFLKDLPDSGTVGRAKANLLMTLATLGGAGGIEGATAAFKHPEIGAGLLGTALVGYGLNKGGQYGMAAALNNPLTRNLLLRGGSDAVAAPVGQGGVNLLNGANGSIVGNDLMRQFFPQPGFAPQQAGAPAQ